MMANIAHCVQTEIFEFNTWLDVVRENSYEHLVKITLRTSYPSKRNRLERVSQCFSPQQ